MSKPSFFAELKRRHVYKVGATYAIAGWLLVQFATQVFPFFEIPNSAVRLVVILVAIGFPIALIVSWIYDLTPEGLVRTDELPSTGETLAATSERRSVDRKLNYLLGALLLIGLGYEGLAHTVLRKTVPATTTADTADKSIAVLPFENLSRDPDNAYFATGMQDEILTRLSKIRALKVISRTSTINIASSPGNLPEIARKLGVSAILEGSVQKSGDKVLVNVQLIRAATDEHLWAESYNRKLDDVFAVQAEVAQAVAEALSANLTGAEQQQLASKPTTNTKAYEFYLRGLAMEGRFSTSADDFRKRAEAYQAAVNLDPNFALAWAGLAGAHTELYFGPDHTPQRLTLAKHALDEAIRIAPEASETWEALGFYRYYALRDYDAAFAAYSKALETRPNAGLIVYVMGNVRRRQGHWDEALGLQTRATELDPLATNTWYNLGLTLKALRRYDDAQTAFDRGLAAVPGDPDLLAEKIDTFLAVGKLDAAAQLFQPLPPESIRGPLGNLKFLLLKLQRDYPAAIAHLQRALQQRAVLSPQAVAGILSGFGEVELLNGARAAGLAHLAESRDLFEKLFQQGDDSPWNYGPLSRAAALLGDRQRAYRYSDLAVEKLANDSIGITQALEAQAFARMLCGDKTQAIAYLRKMQTLPIVYGSTPATLRLDPAWDPLRKEPGFQALIADGAR